MGCIRPLPTKQLTSLFSSPSVASTSLSSSASRSTSTTPVQSEKQDSTTVISSTCKRRIRRRNGGTGVLFRALLDLWGLVPIIILITTTSTPTTVSAVSIAAVSIASNTHGNSKGSGVSHQQHHQPSQLPQPQKLTFLSGNDAKGNGSTVGVLNLSFGELLFISKRQQQQQKKKEMDGKSIKNKRIVKRNVGDTRITSNQDVTTLALAVDNSSSVAIANINSSFNNVYVSIGSNAFPHKIDSGNRFDTHLEEDEDEFE